MEKKIFILSLKNSRIESFKNISRNHKEYDKGKKGIECSKKTEIITSSTIFKYSGRLTLNIQTF